VAAEWSQSAGESDRATEQYLEAQDTLKEWFEDCVTVAPDGAGAFTTELYSSYRQWMTEAGEFPLRQKSFVDELSSRAEEFHIKRSEEKIQRGSGRQGRQRGMGFLGISEVSNPM
jgi:phage/plasmid-associated DNA primase